MVNLRKKFLVLDIWAKREEARYVFPRTSVLPVYHKDWLCPSIKVREQKRLECDAPR
jgi:hypothetical protein